MLQVSTPQTCTLSRDRCLETGIYVHVLHLNILRTNTPGFVVFYNYGCNIRNSVARCILRESTENDSLMMAENVSRNM